MKPKNSPQRTSAFIRFTIFYVITTLIIIAAVFFGLQVPFKENRQLEAQLQTVHREREFDRKLYEMIRSTQRMLDSVNIAKPNTEVVDGRINQNIVAMDAMLHNDSTSAKMIYSELVAIFTEAKNDKAQIRKASDKDEVVKMKDEEIQKLKQNLAGWQEAYNKQQVQLTQLQNRQ